MIKFITLRYSQIVFTEIYIYIFIYYIKVLHTSQTL